MANATLTYHSSAERPEAVITLSDGVDVTSGYEFTLRVGHPGQAAALEKTSGITGGDGTVTVTWSAGELDLTPADYTLQLTATTGGLDRVYHGKIRILEVIGAAE